MAGTFDPYHKWLGIAADEQPADYYRLLGIRAFESDPDVIAGAADQRMMHVRSFQSGRYSQLSQPILNELSAARVCLLNPEKKAAYDARLRAEQQGHPAGSPPLPVPGAVQPGRELPGLSVVVTPAASTMRRKRPDWHVPAAITAAAVAFALGLFALFNVGTNRRHDVPRLPERAATIGETADRNQAVVRERRPSRLDGASEGAAPRPAPIDQPEAVEPLDPQPARLPPPSAVAPFDAEQAANHQRAWAEHSGVPVEKTNSIGMKLVLIPPGEFMMGSNPQEVEHFLHEAKREEAPQWLINRLPAEAPKHPVRITRPFYLGMYEVTQAEYERVMGNNPSRFRGNPTRPVEQVIWSDAVEFCRILSERESRQYRLPTEAEWEYACRAGTTTPWHFGDDVSRLDEYAWFESNSARQTHPVGQKKPNAWGLFDIYGNVWEWCADWFGLRYYANSPTDDPPGLGSGAERVDRGGSWDNYARDCRSAARFGRTLGTRSISRGFRVALVIAANERHLGSETGEQCPLTLSPAHEHSSDKVAERADASTQLLDERGTGAEVRDGDTNSLSIFSDQAMDELRAKMTYGSTVDLLKNVNLQRQRVVGDWKHGRAGLTGTCRYAKHAALAFAYAPAGSYELYMEFTRHGGRDDVVVFLPVGSTACRLSVSALHGQVSSIGKLGGSELPGNTPSRRPGTLKNDHRYVMVIAVLVKDQWATIDVTLDGEPYLRWTGRQASISPPPDWRLPDQKHLGVGMWNTTVTFHDVRVWPIARWER